MIKSLPLDSIRRDGGTQMRAEINMFIVADYAEAYRDGADMPPLVVFYDGSERWLADGFHRWLGAEKAGFDEIACDVRPGQRRDAVLHACGANSSHGLRRSNADKKLAVETMLRDGEWLKKGFRWIARQCGVTHPFVIKVHSELTTSGNDYQMDTDTRTVTRGDTTYEMRTDNIGKTKSSAPLPDQADLFDEPEDEPEPSEEEADETAPDEDDADDELASEGDPADPKTSDDEPEDEPSVPEGRPAQPARPEPEPAPARTNGKASTVPPLHIKFLEALDDFDDFTRAVAAQIHHAGYGGFPAVHGRIPPDQVRIVRGKIQMLADRLTDWLSHFEVPTDD